MTTLLCPNQLRMNGLRVKDVPRQFDAKSYHSIYIPEQWIRIPLSLDSVVSGFESQQPTWAEYNEYPHIELTSTSKWEPSSSLMAEKESQIAAVSSVSSFFGSC